MRRVGGLAGLACALLLLVSCGGGEPAEQAALAQPAARAPARAAQAPLAAHVLDATALFTWAQAHYSQYFAGGYRPGTQDGYQYRHYPLTSTYLGVKDGHVYVLGPVSGGQIMTVGSLASFECQVFPSNCPVTTPPASDAVALSGLYLGTFGGTSQNAVLLVAADGSFVGTNENDARTRTDIFTGTASAQPGAWSASDARYGVYTSNATYATLGSANLTGTFTTAANASASVAANGVTPVSTQLALTYDATVSKTPASLWTAGGLYNTPILGQSVSIDPSSGALSGTLGTGCSASGTVSVPDATRNIYKAQLTLTGGSCAVEGVVELLGYYYTAFNGEQALVWVGSTPGAQLASIAVTLYRPR